MPPKRHLALPGSLARYAHRYGAALARPFTLLTGQVLIFFAISIYVKLAEVRLTPEYAAAWMDSGRLATNGLHALLFCAQEVAMCAGLLVTLAVWRLCDPRGRRLSRWLAVIVGCVILPILSVAEVMGLVHFAYFLTPLGPEEVRTVAWAPMIVSSSNVLDQPMVAAGLVLVGAYFLLPAELWRLRRWLPRRRTLLPAVALVGIVAACLPQPKLTDALLGPHPVLWMLLGNRSHPAWAETLGNESPDTLAGHGSFAGRQRFTVKHRPRNLLVIVLESTRARSLALYDPAVRPGRDLLRLADETVVFDNVYAPVPTSAHALFSILYGVYPYLGPFWSTGDRAVVAESMADVFRHAGYTSQFFITSDLNYDSVRSFAATGFDRVLDPNDWPGQEEYALLPWGRDDRLLFAEIKRFLSARDRRPFFLLAMTSNPHHPYAVNQLFGDAPPADDRTAYERLVDYNLRMVGELYEWMKRRGIAEQTLLLVLGDHGEAFGEHPGNYGHAAFIYEENVHVPCFVLHPRRLGLPHHIAQLGSQIDLRPTVLDILGLHDDAPGDGMSLLHEDPARMVANFTENGVTHFGIRDTRFSYIYTPHVEAEQLFDRQRDPDGTSNIAAREPQLTARYRARLQRWDAQHQLSLAKVLR